MNLAGSGILARRKEGAGLVVRAAERCTAHLPAYRGGTPVQNQGAGRLQSLLPNFSSTALQSFCLPEGKVTIEIHYLDHSGVPAEYFLRLEAVFGQLLLVDQQWLPLSPYWRFGCGISLQSIKDEPHG